MLKQLVPVLAACLLLSGCGSPPTESDVLQVLTKDMNDRRQEQAKKYAGLELPADMFDWKIVSVKIIECRKETKIRYNCTVDSRIRFGDDFRQTGPVDNLFLKTDSGWVLHKQNSNMK